MLKAVGVCHALCKHSGFLPRFEYNQKAIEKAHIGDTTRGDQKAKMLLVSMDQYSRHLMPKYGGFRAQDVTNMHGEELPPTTRTHQGSVNQDVRDSSVPDIFQGPRAHRKE